MSRYVDPSAEDPEAMTPVDSTLADTPVSMGAGSASAGGRFGSPACDDSDSKDSPADEDDTIIDLSNGMRIKFLNRIGWTTKPDGAAPGSEKVAASPTASQKGASEGKKRGKIGKRVTAYAQVTLDYQLLKAIDTVGGAHRYTSFDYASDKPLADRMTPGGEYEGGKDIEAKYIPAYMDCAPMAISGLNLAFPHLREGDEVLIFVPDYLGPSNLDPSLGERFRPRPMVDETTQSLIEPPKPPVANQTYSEHSFIRVIIKKVNPEESLATDRYITKNIISEAKVGGIRLNFEESDEANTTGGAQPPAPSTTARRCCIGSVATYDIGEVNEFVGKAFFFKTVKESLIGGATSCEELDIVLKSMYVGEFSIFRIGPTQYHIKLLDIAPGTAYGERTGDEATALARTLKDVGNDVLSGAATASSKAFSSPVKPSKMGSPIPSSSEGLSNTDRNYYYPTPSDNSYNPLLDSLSSYVVRPPRSSFLLLQRQSKVRNRESHESRVKDELSYRALRSYIHAENVLEDEEELFYYRGAVESDNAASPSPARNPPASKRDRAALEPVPHNKAQREELLGTVSGNMSQVYLNLGFYGSAEESATKAIKYCATTDTFKQYFRRAKARKNLHRAEEAIGDILEAEVALKALHVSANDVRFEELRKEQASCEAALQQQMELQSQATPISP